MFPKNRGVYPKMDGENNGKPYEQMDDLGGFNPTTFGNTHLDPAKGTICGGLIVSENVFGDQKNATLGFTAKISEVCRDVIESKVATG